MGRRGEEMEFWRAIGLKLLFTVITILSLLAIFSEANLRSMIGITLFVFAVSFLIGDLVILRKVSSITATIIDFPLYLLLLWISCDFFLFADILETYGIPLMGATFLTILEPFVHIRLRYAARKSKPDFSSQAYLTESSQEIIEKDEEND